MNQNFYAVCTTDETRRYFTECGLSYDDVLESDILVLTMLLNQEIRKSNKSGETSVSTMRLSHKVNMKRKTNGSIIYCFLRAFLKWCDYLKGVEHEDET